MRTGFYIVGTLKGYKSLSFTNRETGEVKERHNNYAYWFLYCRHFKRL
nr:MAG TPA: Putative Gamma DNA binding protein G5P [Inoviridae sp.]